MSGHSKWSTIKRKKGAIDAARSKVFQKLAKELYVAAKSGDPDPANNAALRMVVEKAKGENMPKANIESAIAKAANKSGGENYDSIRYEGYGPGGIAVMIDCLTDNKNRTAGFVRSTLTKKNGNLGTDGSVSYMFKRKGVIVLENVYDEEKVMEDILSLDILDMEIDEDITIYTEPDNFISVKEELDKKKNLSAIGGIEYLSEVIDSVPTAANLDYYIKIVKDKSELDIEALKKEMKN